MTRPSSDAVPKGSGQTLAGKTALVTGGSRGIGLAVAEAFLREGARVVITGRKPEGIQSALEALRARGLESVQGVAAHSARPEDVERAFAEARAAFGPVTVVVNNAATNPSMSPLSLIELEAFDKIIETNLRGYLIVARAAIRGLREASLPGSIINVSSVASFRTWAGLGAYGVSKAAVNMMTQVLAAEAGPYGIRVNGVAPGLIRTRFSEALWKDPSKEEAAAARLPLRRIGEPEDIAGVAVFLASDASRYVTGQTLPADGGMMVG
jgi:NAD(P)-dependent dehydrogenase (short-subunit alcohol dehydrogenase family)